MMLSLYVVYFLLWSITIWKKRGLNVSCFLVLFYLGSALSCFFLYLLYPEAIEYPERITFVSVTYHIIALTLFISPLVKYGNRISLDDLKINIFKLNFISWFVIVTSLAAIAMSIAGVIDIFVFGNFLNARNAFLEGDVSNLYTTKYGVLGYIPSLGINYSFIALFLSFYYRFFLKKKCLITNLLFISSFAIVINNLAIAGREGAVKWFIFLILTCCIFRKYITYKNNELFWKYLIILGCCSFVIFSIITLDRYGEHDEGALYSVLHYYGQCFYYFSYYFQRFGDEGTRGLLSLFPIISQQKVELYDINSFIIADFFLNTFGTFIGTFVARAGAFSTMVLSIVFYLFSKIIFNKNKTTFCRLIIYLFLLEIVSLGIFYYLHGNLFTQFAILFLILVIILKTKIEFR